MKHRERHEHTGNFSICADVSHGRNQTALDIYRAHRKRIRHYNAFGWLLYFSDEEVEQLTQVVQDVTSSQGVNLPMIQIDALSTSAISIYSYGDSALVNTMRRASKIKVNRADPT